jgi:DNA-binding NarL/FixJ family response regulator
MKKKQRSEKISVMLVDDHARLREALRQVINFEPDLEVVAEVEGGRAALQLLQRINPDVVLMDGSMPEMNGIETTRRLKQLRPKTKIIGLTLYGESTYLEEMVTVGASGYLMKTSGPETLINAIRTVHDGGTYFDSAVPRRHSTSPVSTPSAIKELSVPELAVAKLIAKGQTKSEIAATLSSEIPTVEKHRIAAMKKLGLRSRAGLVRVAAEHNWLAP